MRAPEDNNENATGAQPTPRQRIEILEARVGELEGSLAKQRDKFMRDLDAYATVTRLAGCSWTDNLYANLSHSALLRRIQEGMPLYRYPPPRAFSYPWYDLLDNEHTVAGDVHLREGQDEAIIVDQSTWRLEEITKRGHTYIASWPHYLLRVRLERIGDGSREQGYKTTVLETENTKVDHPFQAVDLVAAKNNQQMR